MLDDIEIIESECGVLGERLPTIIRKLTDEYQNATVELNWETPYELLIATILAAQCTDKRVNQVTPKLFTKLGTPQKAAAATPKQVEKIIHSIPFYSKKAQNIVESSRIITEKFDGEVPRTMDEMLTLPGVARKTANVVLGTAFGIASGIVVDTHVARVSQLLQLTYNTKPRQIENELMFLLAESEWISFSHRIILHGRRVCVARSPKCKSCVLSEVCPSARTTN